MMTTYCALGTSFLPYFPPSNLPNIRKSRKISSFTLANACKLDSEGESKTKKLNRKQLKLLKRKSEEALSPEELKNWTKDLPTVSNRLAYSDILEFRKQGRVKHVVKHPGIDLRVGSVVVFLVLDDFRVWRVVLPSLDTDRKFWALWDKLGLDSVCINAYSPPARMVELPSSYFGFLGEIPAWLFSFVKAKIHKPQSRKLLEARRIREELKRERTDELARMREEREKVEREIVLQKKMDERRKKSGVRKLRYRESLRQADRNYRLMAKVWEDLAADSNVATALGLLFFYIFWQTVVVSYKKQKKDCEDRMKIEKAEAEDRKKMREIEREMREEELEEAREEENDPMKMAEKFMKSGASVRRARARRPPQYLDRGADVKFSDVVGLGKIREELEEVVKYFTNGEMYRRRGIKIPGGILLCGPPGVGKTLLAKAVAGESDVNFFSISASQFVEVFEGVGASRVRDIYQEAKDNAPSIVFIDELDAVGRARGSRRGSEYDRTLNQLLVCLDGFEGRGEVITIAATNRLEILDPALVRPGRFDRIIVLPKPSLIGRLEILQLHARKKQMAEDVDYMAVARITDGMVGAELANILEIAAISMMRDGRTLVTTEDLVQAVEIEDKGMLDRRERSTEMWKQLAINEAAMAVAAVNFPDFRNIEYVTIAPRAGRELGYVRLKMDIVKFKEGMLSRQSLLDYITIQLAPRAADEIWSGKDQMSTIWAEAADNARVAARTLVAGGLSEKHYGSSFFWTVEGLNGIDDEALRILNMCYKQAKEILHKNQKLMDFVVKELVEKKSLSKKEFFQLVDLHGSLIPMRPSLLDLRAAKRSEFQTMMKKKEDDN